MKDSKVVAVILAGGKSTRMGGKEKSLAKCGTKTLIEITADNLKKQTKTFIVNANGNKNRFGFLGCQVIPDTIKGYPGPLAGILAGLKWAKKNKYDAIITVAADTPFFPKNYVRRMKFVAMSARNNQVVIAKTDRLHPVFGIWNVSITKKLETFLGKGETNKIMAFVEQNKWKSVEFQNNNNPFFNVNTPKELKEAKKMLAGKPIIFGITGWKNSGKTTLVQKLVRELVRRKKRVNTIKHASKQFEVDKKDSDSYKHQKAGSTKTAIIAQNKWAVIGKQKGEIKLKDMIRNLGDADVILVEGFKNEPIKKIECIADENLTPIYESNKSVVAVATRTKKYQTNANLHKFTQNDIKKIADFVMNHGNKK